MYTGKKPGDYDSLYVVCMKTIEAILLVPLIVLLARWLDRNSSFQLEIGITTVSRVY